MNIFIIFVFCTYKLFNKNFLEYYELLPIIYRIY